MQRGRGLFPSCSLHSAALWWHRGGTWGGPFSSSLISTYLLIPNISGRAPQASTCQSHWLLTIRSMHVIWMELHSKKAVCFLKAMCFLSQPLQGLLVFFLFLNYNWIHTFTHSFTLAWIHTHTYIHELTHTHTYTHSYTHLHILIYSLIHTCSYIHTHIHMHIHIQTLTCICVHVCVRARTHTHTHTHYLLCLGLASSLHPVLLFLTRVFFT